jgi:uncharacterized membrane-anchored protein
MVTTTASLLGQGDHPQRRALIEEMHVRRFPSFAAPARVLQIVVYTVEQTPETVRRHAESLCEHYLLPAPPNGKSFSVQLSGVEFVWEQHSEFSTYSLIKPGAFTAPFAGSLLEEVPQAWLSALPGRILRATQIALLAQSDPEPSREWLAELFALEELVCCDVLGGEARIWSNFRLHGDGLGRLLIRDQALIGDGDPSRLLQRLQELGNYRNMALLGLPLAQRMTPTLSALEQRLAELTREICERSEPEDQLLHHLTTLSADLARLEAETSYRMSATRAYAQLVADRLDSIQVQRVRGFQTLADFTDRRLTPAVRTCESFTRRLENLSQRASWASSLMRTRIETALEHQTRDLLESMNRAAHVQLRLQQAVEGLSIIAISYYAVGLVGYMAKSVSHYFPSIDANTVAGASAPIVVLGTWWLMRRVHRRLAHAAYLGGN